MSVFGSVKNAAKAVGETVLDVNKAVGGAIVDVNKTIGGKVVDVAKTTVSDLNPFGGSNGNFTPRPLSQEVFDAQYAEAKAVCSGDAPLPEGANVTKTELCGTLDEKAAQIAADNGLKFPVSDAGIGGTSGLTASTASSDVGSPSLTAVGGR